MLLQTLLKHLTTVIDSAVVKYDKTAQENETLQSRRIADYYEAAVTKTSEFYSYDRFSQDAIINAGVPVYDIANYEQGQYTAMTYVADKERIPVQYRDRVVEEQRKIIISNYEENGDYNNYYRQLSGLPGIGDTDFISLPPDVYERYNIDPSLYIHQIDIETLRTLSHAGIIDSIIAEYPDKEYLKHLGDKKIPSLKARRANNFSLLYINGDDVPTSFYDMFNRIYEQNREYVCTVLYNNSMSKAYDLYDNFMAMCIMFMTMQRMVSLSFRQGISRDLYDWEFIQNLYASYNIPFIDTLPIDTHMTLIKNFNHLLQHKSTDKVLFDLCSLLGYSNIELEKYYLVRTHKTDDNGNPIFVYDENGNPNYREMYDLYFKTVPLDAKNVALALQDNTATKSYEEVTENDPYWWDSGDLKDTILEDDFNYYETKYITLNTIYNMSDIMFELTYSMRSILDQKENIDKYSVSILLPKINMDRPFSLFDIAVFIIAGLCKMNGLKGTILNSASKISHIYGYRNNAYDADMTDALLYELTNGAEGAITGTEENPYVSGASSAAADWLNRSFETTHEFEDDENITYKDTTTQDHIVNDGNLSNEWVGIENANEFNYLFSEIKRFENNLVTAMWNATDINQYNAYRAIYDIYMTKKAVDTMFTKSDGSIASTYLEYLEDSEVDLFSIINETEPEDLYDILNHAVGRLQEEMDSLENLNMLTDDGNTAYDALMSLINFFKSYTVDIHNFNIWYVFDSKYYNSLRFFHKLGLIKSEMLTRDSMNYLYSDCIHSDVSSPIHDSLHLRDTITRKWEN